MTKVTNSEGSKTTQQYQAAVAKCREIFAKKTHDYGTAWRVLRTPSLTDQLFIKAKRIRTIEEKGEQRVDEGVEPEFIGLVNYSAMALIQLELGHAEEAEMPETEAVKLFEIQLNTAYELMMNKNHDYGEAWREMRISSFTDLILMKLLRIKQIENLEGKTLISEGLDANYYDIINYAIFALIKLQEAHEDSSHH